MYEIYVLLEISVNSLNNLFNFSGAAIKLRKCAWYILRCVSNNKDKPVLETKRETLFIKNNPSSSTIYLGVTSQPSGLQTVQLKKIKDVAKELSKKLTVVHLPYYLSYTYY